MLFMKNNTQTISASRRNFFNKFFTTIGLMLTLLLGNISFAQNGIIGSGFGSNDWTTTDTFTAGAGNSRIFSATPNGTGNQYFRLVRNWGGNFTQFGPFGCVDTDWTNPGVVYGMSDCGSGAFYINCPNTTDNYIFKTPNGDVSKDLLYFRVQGAVRTVSDVSQMPLTAGVTECRVTTVTATLDGDLSEGQEVYMRYTKDGYATSTVVKLTWSGTAYTATIPYSFNTLGANVSYYLFTSGKSGVALDGSNADLFTINLNNNSGPNYSYTVAAGGATTAIPDSNFEQALINLGLDCAIDGLVFTSNITNVTLLDLRDKNISSLVGIKAFVNLQQLFCNNDVVGGGNDNTISNLDVSGMNQLRYFYCQNNLITTLNITGLNSLQALDTSNNPLATPTLDVHLFPNLFYLVCQNNGLTSLNISGLTNLQTLIVWNNSLTTLNVSNNPNLTYLDCDENAFTTININGLTNLEYFYCSYNALTAINVSAATNLIEFNCNNNSLSSMDVRGLSNLAFFDCSNNISLTCILVDNVAAANAKVTLGNWKKDLAATYSYCNCSLTTTWNGSSWDNGAPTTGTYAAIISDDYIGQTAHINACSLTVTNGIVIIPSGTNVTLNAPITVNPGSVFVLNNNANLIQINKNSVNNGEILVIRNSSPLFRLDYTMWSSPVYGNQTLGGFSPSTVSSRYYQYNTDTDLYNAVPSTTPFVKAKGYLIRMPDNSVDYVASPPSIPASWQGNFSGTPNNGDITYAMSNALNGYNAVGNPYPSTLDIDKFIAGNIGQIDGTLWFWRKRNDASNGTSYSTCTTAGCTLNNSHPYLNQNFVSVGQGFIVKATAFGNLNFTNTMRVSNNQNQFFKTKQIEKNRIWLNLSNDTTPINQMLVAYVSGASQGVDRTIDGKYINDSQTALNSLIGSDEFAIQGRSLPFDETDIVPLAFKTDAAGDFTIAIDHVDGLFSGSQDVFLKDNTTGIETDLKSGAYTFTAAAGVDNARFSLKYQKTLGVNAAIFDDSSVTIYKNKGTLYVNSSAVAIANIKVFDIQGRLIAERKNVRANTATITNLKANQQLLIVKVTGLDNKVVSKKVVN